MVNVQIETSSGPEDRGSREDFWVYGGIAASFLLALVASVWIAETTSDRNPQANTALVAMLFFFSIFFTGLYLLLFAKPAARRGQLSKFLLVFFSWAIGLNGIAAFLTWLEVSGPRGSSGLAHYLELYGGYFLALWIGIELGKRLEKRRTALAGE